MTGAGGAAGLLTTGVLLTGGLVTGALETGAVLRGDVVDGLTRTAGVEVELRAGVLTRTTRAAGAAATLRVTARACWREPRSAGTPDTGASATTLILGVDAEWWLVVKAADCASVLRSDFPPWWPRSHAPPNRATHSAPIIMTQRPHGAAIFVFT